MMLPVPVSQRAIAKRFSQLPKYYTFEEVGRILSADLKRDNYDAWFLCSFLWNTGARISEGLSVLNQDIDYAARTVRLITLKRKRPVERVLPLKPEMLLECQLYRQCQQERQTTKKRDLRKVFNFNRQSAFNYVVESCRFAGLADERAHPHSFRHSFAINCLLQGIPLTKLQQWLGHANILNTLVYAAIANHADQTLLAGVEFISTGGRQ